MTFDLQRQGVSIEPGHGSHPGHILSCGLSKWATDPTVRGESHASFISELCNIQLSECYLSAFNRWKLLIENSKNIAQWEGRLQTRLYIGLGNPTCVEANIAVHQTYGTPLISGSAIKGLIRAYARKHKIDQVNINIILGEESKTDQMSKAGYLVFHDAWWVPGSANTPFVPEIVTVHHSKYYESEGAEEATDFDSPNPNAQICAQGSFLFTIEGPSMWANWAKSILVHALTNEGIGGKLSSGYGLFEKPDANDAEPQDVIWEDAFLQWNPGRKQLSATSNIAKATATASIDIEKENLAKLLGIELSNSKLKQLTKGTIKKRVKVKFKGNIYQLSEIFGD